MRILGPGKGTRAKESCFELRMKCRPTCYKRTVGWLRRRFGVAATPAGHAAGIEECGTAKTALGSPKPWDLQRPGGT